MNKLIKSILDFDLKILNKWQFSKLLLILGAVLSISWSVYFMYKTVLIPHQLTTLEGAANVHTWFYLRGMNPFTLDNQPIGITLYGFVYNLIVFPFAVWFGNTPAIHRAVNLVFILLSSIIYYQVIFREKKNHLLALACSALIITSLAGIQGLGGISAYPAPTGMFFFIAAVFIPFLFSFDSKSLILSLLFTLAGFYIKPYFLLAFGVVASYVFLFVSPKKGLIYGLSFLGALLASIFVVKNIFPLYFVGTIWANVYQTKRSLEHLLYQLSSLTCTFLPLIIISLLAFVADGTKMGGEKRPYKINFSKWNEPLLGYSPNYIFYAFVITLLAFITILGWHAPNPLGYAYQLVAPLFICLVFGILTPANRTNLLAVLLIVLNMFTWQSKIMSPDYLEEKTPNEWARLLGYLDGTKAFIHPPMMVTDVMARGYAPMDSGQTIIFYTILPYPNTILTDIPYERVRQDGIGFTNNINRRIERRGYDVVIIQKDKSQFFDTEILEQNYDQVDEITVNMNFGGEITLQVWKPKP